MFIIVALTLIDIHTLFVLLFSSVLPKSYIFAGSAIIMFKGLIFYLLGKDFFSLLDIITGIIMLFLMLGSLFSLFYWVILIYLIYKILTSFAAFK